MKTKLENVKPKEIETRSFEIITEELGDKKLQPGTELIVKRWILIMRIICIFPKMRFLRQLRRLNTGHAL